MFASRSRETAVGELGLPDQEIASVMGWSEEQVERVRRIYVDDAARNVALGRRIARGM